MRLTFRGRVVVDVRLLFGSRLRTRLQPSFDGEIPCTGKKLLLSHLTHLDPVRTSRSYLGTGLLLSSRTSPVRRITHRKFLESCRAREAGRVSVSTRCKIETRASADTGLPYSLCDPSPTIRPTCECYSERMSPSHLHCCALHQLITVPTRMNLTVTKTRLKGAQTGHSLLKKKADALNKVRFSPALQ